MALPARRLFPVGILVAFCAAPLAAAALEPGRAVFGDKNYIEYIPGDLPLVISAPHGGGEKPDEIPVREKGVVTMDTNTQELARAIGDEIFAHTGHRAHLVFCRVHRQKLDCNREIGEAAFGSKDAEKAWNEYHAFIDQALAAAVGQAGKAFLIDLHGQSHKDQQLELGYLHSAQTLAEPETKLNAREVASAGSLRRMAERSKLPYVELLRGSRSLGALFEAQGFPATPGPQRPVPGLPYFQGGYTVRRHIATEALIAGVQIECNMDGVRDTAENRTRFATAVVIVLRGYLAEHFDLELPHR